MGLGGKGYELAVEAAVHLAGKPANTKKPARRKS